MRNASAAVSDSGHLYQRVATSLSQLGLSRPAADDWWLSHPLGAAPPGRGCHRVARGALMGHPSGTCPTSSVPRQRTRYPVNPQGGFMARMKERPAYDAFMLSRANRPNIGPYSLLLHMPEMAQRLEALRIYLRDEASLPPKLQELVMISVAREMGCAFIWYAHAAAARQAGVRDDTVDGIREKRALAGLDSDEQTVVDFTRELLQNRKVSRPTFDAATARFGPRGTMALTNLIACYAVLAYNLNTYDLEAPTHPTERPLTM